MESDDGTIFAELPIEAVYYWLDGRLHHATAIQMLDSSINFEYSDIFFDGALFISEIQTQGESIRYYGWKSGNHAWWSNPLTDSATPFTISNESVTPTSAGFLLQIHGHQWDRNTGNYLGFTAAMKRLSPNEAFDFME